LCVAKKKRPQAKEIFGRIPQVSFSASLNAKKRPCGRFASAPVH
jgi:hypothetical protein